jgi:hypothetical protein
MALRKHHSTLAGAFLAPHCVGDGAVELPTFTSGIPSSMTQLDLTRKLAQPITLTGGPRSHLVTLMDAAILIRDLEQFRQARPVWDRAAEMIVIAGTTKKKADIAEATRQLLVALGHENWWKGGWSRARHPCGWGCGTRRGNGR